MGLFGFFQCLLVQITERDTYFNQAIAGALTGGLINIRGGWKYSMRGAISGGIFIGVFNIFEIVMVKKQLQMENNIMQTQLRMSYIDQLEQLKTYNPRNIKRTGYMLKRRLGEHESECCPRDGTAAERCLLLTLKSHFWLTNK